MISLTLVLAALVLLTFWDSAEAGDNRETVPVESDDHESSFRNR